MGALVGFVGAGVGNVVGKVVGFFVGLLVGAGVGVSVGAGVGVRVGAEVGTKVGWAVGAGVVRVHSLSSCCDGALLSHSCGSVVQTVRASQCRSDVVDGETSCHWVA